MSNINAKVFSPYPVTILFYFTLFAAVIGVEFERVKKCSS